MTDLAAIVAEMREPARQDHDWSDKKLGACDQCGDSWTWVVRVEDENHCAPCCDANHLAEWKDYAAQLRAALHSQAQEREGWVSDPPSQAGWYWSRHEIAGLLKIVEVFVRPGHSSLVIQGETYGMNGKRDYIRVDKLGCEWCGPIPLPAAPTGGSET